MQQPGGTNSSGPSRPDGALSGAAPATSSSTSSFLWAPLTSLFTSREQSPGETNSPTSGVPASSSAVPGPIQPAPTAGDSSSGAFKWLSSLASVFTSKEAQGAITVSFTPIRTSTASSSHNTAEMEYFEVYKTSNEHTDGIKTRIMATIRGEGLPSRHPNHDRDRSQIDNPMIAIDEGFVYISHNNSGMQTEDGDYVMYGHVAIPSLVHQHLLSRGIKPKNIQTALDEHDSNPDHAVDWLLSQQIYAENDGSLAKVQNLAIKAREPFDVQLTTFPFFVTEMTSLVTLELCNHSFTTIPTYFIFSLPLLETLKLSSNGIRSFLTAEQKPSPPATSTSLQASSSSLNTKTSKTLAGNATYAPVVGGPILRTGVTIERSDGIVVTESESWRYGSPESMLLQRGVPRLRHLDLSHNMISTLPIHISVLANLTHLNVSNNWLRALPEELTSMPINTLYVEANQLFDLPIANSLSTVSPLMYSNLTHLSISHNNIKLPLLSLNARTLLQNLNLYRNVSTLNIAHNALSPLPNSVLQHAPTLTSLDLSFLGLRTLAPTEIKTFVHLRSLSLAHNGLEKLPIELCTLAHLSSLDISYNELTTLPQGLPGLRLNLKSFDLSWNKLSILPPSFGTLINLDRLNLCKNQLSDQSLEVIAPLTLLQHLDLGANSITTLPQKFSALENLSFLSLGGNPLVNVGTLPFYGKLEELNLNNTPLNALPRLCSELSSLRCLHVGQTTMRFDRTSGHSRRQPKSSSARHSRRLGQQKHVEVTAQNPDLVNLSQLISLMRSCPHELILGGMVQLCMDPSWHAKLLKANLVNELSYLVLSTELPAAQVRTLMAIKTLCKNPGNHNFIGEDKQIVTTLTGIVQTNLPFVKRDKRASLMLRLALDSLCYLSYDPLIRRGMNMVPTATSVGQILRARTHADSTSSCSEDENSSTPTLSALWDESYGLNEMVRYLSTLDYDQQLSARAQRTLHGLGVSTSVSRPDIGIRVLSIDGGGTRGFVVLLMLSILEKLTGKRIMDLFDLVVGTSTGGLITGLVAWSPASMEEAVPYYRILCKTIFTPKGQPVLPPSGAIRSSRTPPISTLFGADDEEEISTRIHGSTDLLGSSGDLSYSGSFEALSGESQTPTPKNNPKDTHLNTDGSSLHPAANEAGEHQSNRWLGSGPWQRLTGIISMFQTRSYYETTPMEDVLKDLAGEHVSMLDTAGLSPLKFALCCTRSNVFPPQPYMLRNYNLPFNSPQDSLDGNATFRLWESVRATTAAPGYFDPLVKDGLHLVDGAMTFNNPIALALTEAKALWPDTKIGCVVSCGTGARPPQPTEVTMGVILSALVDSATETEKTAKLAKAALPSDVYFRLQPCGDVFDFPIDETRMERFEEMEKFMVDWLEKNGDLFLQIADALTKPR